MKYYLLIILAYVIGLFIYYIKVIKKNNDFSIEKYPIFSEFVLNIIIIGIIPLCYLIFIEDDIYSMKFRTILIILIIMSFIVFRIVNFIVKRKVKNFNFNKENK